MTFDLGCVRADFPALTSGTAFFDSPGGTQVPRAVAEAVARALGSALSNRGTQMASQRLADRIVFDARAAMADLLNADPRGIVFGRSATQLTFDFARTLSRTWGPGDEVVVTRLDHDANIRPWVIVAEDCGATVRWVDFDPDTGELDPATVLAAVNPRTRLVAVTAASNLIGTMPDVAAMAPTVHEADALLWVDGVHYAPHASVDVVALGCDFFVCSAYKFLGPHHGILAASPELLETLHPDKLLPSSDAVPERFELGTLPYEYLVGTTAAVDYLAGLAGPAAPTGGSTATNGQGSRRSRLVAAYAATHEHEGALQRQLEQGLTNAGATVYSRAARRTSTLLFTLPNESAAVTSDRLAAAGVLAPSGHFYALEASAHLGLGDVGGVRAGVTVYNDASDVERLLTALS